MTSFTRCTFLFLLFILCSYTLALTETKPLYKVEVISPKPGDVFKRCQPITLKIDTAAPQGPEILELYCELIEIMDLSPRPSQELVVGILNRQITGGPAEYQIVTDHKGPNTISRTGNHTLRLRELINSGTRDSTIFQTIDIPIVISP
ncbi:17431_t:CDS:2 [Acaulospora morrowiae]|uniref:17431_t:CDS:1 n=1 Tax=Acaulospora morrowiae TaxID=94023 RepID=A0A9N8Z1T6_9GLOM|nr:17431_t:CDS:2 [Acaulospora morrowiae]